MWRYQEQEKCSLKGRVKQIKKTRPTSGTYLKSAVSDMNTKHDLPRGALHQNSQAVKKLKNTDWNMGFLMARTGRFHISWAIIRTACYSSSKVPDNQNIRTLGAYGDTLQIPWKSTRWFGMKNLCFVTSSFMMSPSFRPRLTRSYSRASVVLTRRKSGSVTKLARLSTK